MARLSPFAARDWQRPKAPAHAGRTPPRLGDLRPCDPVDPPREVGRVDRLTPLAASFLEAEDVDDTASLAIGSFAIFRGQSPISRTSCRGSRAGCPLMPRYRQRLRRVPFDLVAPAWVDDPDFDVRWHIRNTALPCPWRTAVRSSGCSAA